MPSIRILEPGVQPQPAEEQLPETVWARSICEHCLRWFDYRRHDRQVLPRLCLDCEQLSDKAPG